MGCSHFKCTHHHQHCIPNAFIKLVMTEIPLQQIPWTSSEESKHHALRHHLNLCCDMATDSWKVRHVLCALFKWPQSDPRLMTLLRGCPAAAAADPPRRVAWQARPSVAADAVIYCSFFVRRHSAKTSAQQRTALHPRPRLSGTAPARPATRRRRRKKNGFGPAVPPGPRW